MNGADLFEDGYPHGTVEGFKGGCRGGACPGALDYGMTCKRANTLRSGDIRYDKLAKAGAPPAVIALELGEVEPEQLTPEALATVDAYRGVPTSPAPAKLPAPAKMPSPAALPTPPELPAPKSTGTKTRGQVIRGWCDEQGIPVAARGALPRAIIDQFDQAHGVAAANPYTDVLDEARDRAAETTDAAQPLAESSHDRTAAHEPSDAPSESPAPAELDDAGRREEMGHPDEPADNEQPRPEWADVAISVDVERARNLAVRLEGELAEAERRLADALAQNEQLQSALTIALTAWAKARNLATRYLRLVRLAETSERLAWEASYRANRQLDLISADIAAGRLVRPEPTVDAHVERSPWWKRATSR